ncbi:MAG: DUF1080 domain-containing protein [Gemmatimonadales bacterium]
MTRRLSVLFAATLGSIGRAQAPPAPSRTLPPVPVSLATLSAFQPTTTNWSIVGVASADRGRPLTLATEPGTGVLVNSPVPGARGNLFTTWEHGDLDLSLEVMMPKESNSGVYLMGRYEVQLLDSWGVKASTFADLGGIYQRWDDARGAGREGFEGAPPRHNASRAPGLWQHLEISFRAPTFAGGRKVTNARFVVVKLNGVVVQENVDVTGPTRAAAFLDEVAAGPLMIQGDHGPVALRNIQYKRYTDSVRLTALRYQAFEGEPVDSANPASRRPVREGSAIAISAEPARGADRFAVSFEGTMIVPKTGRYRFELGLHWIGGEPENQGPEVGGGKLTIDGKPVVVHAGAARWADADVDLGSGPHSFQLTFYQNRPEFTGRDVELWVEGPEVARRALHAPSLSSSVRPPPGPIVVAPQVEPVVLRSFVFHRGAKRVTAVSVADPHGVHYSYDLAQGALLHAWRGPFLETTQMWHSRGDDQVAQPLGSALTLPGTPALAFLADAGAAWPDSADEKQFRRSGYEVDSTGHPTFLYQVGDVAVEDEIRPTGDGLSLRRELRLRAAVAGTGRAGLYVQVAEDVRVTRQGDGSYVVGDRAFYVVLPDGGEPPVIRQRRGREELLLPVRLDRGEATVAYTIIW